MKNFKSAIAVAMGVFALSPCQSAENTYGPEFGDFAGLECISSKQNCDTYDNFINRELEQSKMQQEFKNSGILNTLYSTNTYDNSINQESCNQESWLDLLAEACMHITQGK